MSSRWYARYAWWGIAHGFHAEVHVYLDYTTRSETSTHTRYGVYIPPGMGEEREVTTSAYFDPSAAFFL